MTTLKHDKKHLTTTQRIKIEDGLNQSQSGFKKKLTYT